MEDFRPVGDISLALEFVQQCEGALSRTIWQAWRNGSQDFLAVVLDHFGFFLSEGPIRLY